MMVLVVSEVAKRKASAVLLRRCIGKATSQAWSGTDDKPLPTQRKRGLSVLGRCHAFEGDFIIPHHFSCPSPGHVQHRHKSPMLHFYRKRKAQQEKQSLK